MGKQNGKAMIAAVWAAGLLWNGSCDGWESGSHEWAESNHAHAGKYLSKSRHLTDAPDTIGHDSRCGRRVLCGDKPGAGGYGPGGWKYQDECDLFFGVSGICEHQRGCVYPAAVPKTGQTTSLCDQDDDGALQKGVPWPNPRFTVGADTNVVTDNLTGLMWARNANLFGVVNWGTAVTNCNNLNYGGYTDWRLPNIMRTAESE